MAGSGTKVTLMFLAALAITIPCLEARIGEFDEYLRKQAAEARRAAREAYEPFPSNVTSHFNSQVHLAMDGSNSTRRGLGVKDSKKYKGPCVAYNPIDRCWRCRPDWADDRFRLAKCAMGFGRKTTGGLGGRIYVVTDKSDDDLINPKPGTLRHAVIQKEPLWIIFQRNMIIKLRQELLVASHKTIDGRGVNVQIKGGGGITLQFVKNVIIHGIRIREIKSLAGGLIRDSVDHVGFRTRSDGDAIGLFGATNVWIDHVSLSETEDGLIDVIQGSTGVTISNCHLAKHNDVMLFGANDMYTGDKVQQVTVAFNHFGAGLIQRMPRCRHGFFHVVNNDYTHWIMYAIGGSSGPTILSQGNRFIAPDNQAAKEVTHRDYAPEAEWDKWQWASELDVMMNGAYFVPSGAPIKKFPPGGNGAEIRPRPGTQVSKLTKFSGPLNCKVGRVC